MLCAEKSTLEMACQEAIAFSAIRNGPEPSLCVRGPSCSFTYRHLREVRENEESYFPEMNGESLTVISILLRDFIVR